MTKKQRETIKQLRYDIESLKLWLKIEHEAFLEQRTRTSNAVFKIAEIKGVPIHEMKYRP